jgi:septal ring-binding cell division protein DamX
VQPVEDPGQPAMLALANHPAHSQLAVESADQAEPVDAAAPASDFALAEELPAINAIPSMDPNVGEAQFEDSGEAALADAGLETVGGPRFVSREVVQSVPVSQRAKPAAAPRAAKPAPAKAAPVAMASGDYNIQLGSYFSMSDAQAAWKVFQNRHPELADAERLITKARVNGKIYYRVAAAGFAKASAQSICRSVKSSGAGCIAYAASSPLPGALNVVRDGVRVAAR